MQDGLNTSIENR